MNDDKRIEMDATTIIIGLLEDILEEQERQTGLFRQHAEMFKEMGQEISMWRNEDHGYHKKQLEGK